MAMFHQPKLLLPEAYLRDAVKTIRRAHTSVYLLTMIIYDDPSTEELFRAICDAAQRGVHVQVVGDTFSYMERAIDYRPGVGVKAHFRPVTCLKRRITASGGSFHWLGNHATTVLTSRTHSKWLVVDDIVYSFGGTNLYPASFSNIDYMIKIKDVGLATHLIAEQKRILSADRQGHAYRSHKFGDDNNLVLVDGGFVGDSIIYRHASRLAEKAREITYVSQYCPTGRLARILRTKPTLFYYNPASSARGFNALAIKIGAALSGIHTLYTRDAYLHAKCMIFTMPDGEKVALTGSHNFPHGGVWMGTREIALETRDQRIVKQLETFVARHVA